MAEFTRSVILASAAEVYRWHLRPGAFERLIPPWESIVPPSRLEGIREGSRVNFTLRKGPTFACAGRRCTGTSSRAASSWTSR